MKNDKAMFYVCIKCFNSDGGPLKQIGTRRDPAYVHLHKCLPLNEHNRLQMAYQSSPVRFWIGILNIGVDYDRSYLWE
jgi:hypothetical protein